jgi:hypothetical protein
MGTMSGESNDREIKIAARQAKPTQVGFKDLCSRLLTHKPLTSATIFRCILGVVGKIVLENFG